MSRNLRWARPQFEVSGISFLLQDPARRNPIGCCPAQPSSRHSYWPEISVSQLRNTSNSFLSCSSKWISYLTSPGQRIDWDNDTLTYHEIFFRNQTGINTDEPLLCYIYLPDTLPFRPSSPVVHPELAAAAGGTGRSGRAAGGLAAGLASLAPVATLLEISALSSSPPRMADDSCEGTAPATTFRAVTGQHSGLHILTGCQCLEYRAANSGVKTFDCSPVQGHVE